MSNTEHDLKEQFIELYSQWEGKIKDPKIQISSRPQDYIDNEPYREIVKLGKRALPLILEKIEAGVFFMNQAALEIEETGMDEIVAEERSRPQAERADFAKTEMPPFLSENQKSELILRYMKSRKK